LLRERTTISADST